jgi:hypothetical protein
MVARSSAPFVRDRRGLDSRYRSVDMRRTAGCSLEGSLGPCWTPESARFAPIQGARKCRIDERRLEVLRLRKNCWQAGIGTTVRAAAGMVAR